MIDARTFFESLFERHGNRPETLDWSERGQRIRFEVLAQIGELEGKSILDVGSGLGHLYGFLRDRLRVFRYRGYDLSPRLVQAAKQAYPDATFEVRDVLKNNIGGTYDFVLSSGLNNLETGTNDRDMRSFLRNAWGACRLGTGVNMLSRWAARRERRRHFYDPISFLRYAKRLTPRVVLRHDYLPHDFTLYLFREAPP